MKVPTGAALFPKELALPPRKWAEARYNIVQWTEMTGLQILKGVARLPYGVWRLAPTGELYVGNARSVVGMKMGEKNAGNRAHRNSKLPKAYRRAAPDIEQKLLGSNFYQRGRSETVRPRCGRRRAKHRDLQILRLSQRRVQEDHQRDENLRRSRQRP